MNININITIDDKIINHWKRAFNKQNLGRILMLAALVPIALHATPVTIPNTFAGGNAISASEMNANFAAVKAAVDDNDARITSNTTSITNQDARIGSITHYNGTTCTNCLSIPSGLAASGTISSLTVTPPSNGTIQLFFNGWVNATPSGATNIDTQIAVSITTGTAVSIYNSGAFYSYETNLSATKIIPISSSVWFSVTGGTSYTFNTNVQSGIAINTNAATTYTGKLTGIFLPD